MKNEKNKLQFTMPYNGDPQIIDVVCKKFSKDVHSFYGNFVIDRFGGGRALQKTQYTDWGFIEALVSKLRRHHIDFNYVINNTNLLNREFNRNYQQQFINFISDLMNVGINTITLSNIYFIQMIKKLFPKLQISASVNLKTRSLEEFQFLLSLGITDITLHYDILKNHSELEKIRKTSNIVIKLIPNDVYIMNCPWQKGHTRMQGAHSRNTGEKTPYFSYYRNKCVNLRHKYPEEILKAMWIAPNNLKKYIEMGYNNFKLLDRLATTRWNIACLELYKKQLPLSNLETFLGTYGKSATTETLESLSTSDKAYPREKLEVIPSIDTNSEKFQNLTNYFLDDDHPKECFNCRACLNISKQLVNFHPQAKKQAIINNEIWQSQITKPSFIKKLSYYKDRTKYE